MEVAAGSLPSMFLPQARSRRVDLKVGCGAWDVPVVIAWEPPWKGEGTKVYPPTWVPSPFHFDLGFLIEFFTDTSLTTARVSSKFPVEVLLPLLCREDDDH